MRRLAQTGGLESETSYIWQHPRRRLDRRARLQQHRRRIPRAAHELIARPVWDARLDDAVAEADFLLVHVDRHGRLRRPADGLLEPLQIFLAAGFQWRKAGCSMCLGMNDDKLQGREMSASSSNRNFIGRQGSPTGRTLLMSPAMVAAAAITGVVTDVREILR